VVGEGARWPEALLVKQISGLLGGKSIWKFILPPYRKAGSIMGDGFRNVDGHTFLKGDPERI
jgi:hypothetical protein